MAQQQAQRPQNVTWRAVPQFGAWDQKNQEATDYSVIFNQARANRKQHKTDVRRSLGNDRELIGSSNPHKPLPPRQFNDFRPRQYPRKHPRYNQDSASKKNKILTYINCCIKP